MRCNLLPFLLAALALALITAPSFGQTTIFSEDFEGGTLGDFSEYSVASNANWTHETASGDGVAQMNGFGADEASDDWLISSSLDFSSTNSEELTADIGKEFDGPDLTLEVSTDYSGSGDPTTATWTEEQVISSAGAVTVDLSGYTGNGSVYVAFHYTSTGTEAGDGAEFTVDDVMVTSTNNPIVRFASANYTAAEDAGTTDLTVELAGPDPSDDIDVDVEFNSGNSSSSAGDIDNYGTQTVSFASSASSGDTKTVTVTLTDDTDQEGNEDAEFGLANLSSSGGASIGSPSTTTLTIVGDDRTIDDVRTALRNGTNEEFVLEGTVSRAFGSYARLQDASGPTGASAIVIRQVSGSNSSSFQQAITDGTIQPGTQLRVHGTLSHFSGLIQINDSDLTSFSVQGQGAPPAAQEVTLSDLESNGEDYESELVRITGLSFPSATGSFAADNGYDVVDGTQSTPFTFYVPTADESALDGESIPTGTFTFEDVLGQFNSFGDVTDDTGYQLISIRPSTALPVELTALNASRNGQAVTLTWATASETGNAGFNVQHRDPNSSSWSKLGFVEGAGTTSEAQSYRFETGALKPGEHLFRLRQNDLDGASTLSKNVRVEIQPEQSVTLTGPNPVSAGQRLQLTVQVESKQPVNIAIHDVLGQQVRTIRNGQLAPSETFQTRLDVSTLSSGVYFVRVFGSSVNEVQKFSVVQ